MPVTILLVDDEPALLRLMSTALTNAGYRVFQAHDGAEAASLFEREGKAIDLLITDMQMPYVDGPRLVGMLRARRPSLRVIGISGRPPATQATDAFLQKPFAREELVAKVRELLAPVRPAARPAATPPDTPKTRSWIRDFFGKPKRPPR